MHVVGTHDSLPTSIKLITFLQKLFNSFQSWSEYPFCNYTKLAQLFSTRIINLRTCQAKILVSSCEKRFIWGDEEDILPRDGHKINSRLSRWILSLCVFTEYLLKDDRSERRGEGVSQSFFLNSIFAVVLVLCQPELSTRDILVDCDGVRVADGRWNLWKCSKSEDKFEIRCKLPSFTNFLNIEKVTTEDLLFIWQKSNVLLLRTFIHLTTE